MRKYKYKVYTGNDERSDIISIPDRKIVGMTEEQITAYVENDFQQWLKHNAEIGWEQVE